MPTPHGKEVGKEVTSAFSGAVANDFQKNIAQYNRYVDELRQQAALGWRIMDGWVDAPVAGKPALFRLRVIDDEGMPVTGAQVSVQFMFTADKSHDTEVVLPEVEPGFYGEPVTLPQSGLWALLINVNRGKDVYEVRGNQGQRCWRNWVIHDNPTATRLFPLWPARSCQCPLPGGD
ncbi:MAG: FixH family protein [Candidatus Thiothrix singaporensis]|uniref:FixH family protein n=1 Tax=Candidatus Thiothrix singaporensis TaxID=2799669 RepID=A0A7L6AR63_9GAMM|nr:MAG: FixH family protein [Candidatus Thiothrix singaporensis]